MNGKKMRYAAMALHMVAVLAVSPYVSSAVESSVEREKGDVLGTGSVIPASAARILQHVEKKVLINDQAALKAADVDGDGKVTKEDAQLILQISAGTSQLLSVSTGEIPAAKVNQAYSYMLKANGGEAPYTWSIKSGSSLPTGLSLNSSTGEISGKATQEGKKEVVFVVKDNKKRATEKKLSVSAENVKYINSLQLVNNPILSFHTVTAQVSPDVFSIKVNQLSMHYEGNNEFSVATAKLTGGSKVTVIAYDKFGNVLERKEQIVP